MKSCYNYEAKIENRFFAPRYFCNIFKRSWAQTLLFGIAQFFAINVYFALYLNNHLRRTNYELAYEYLVEESYLTALIVICCAIFAAFSATNYLNTRRNANFVHSLPLRREALYFTKYANGALTFILPFTLNILILTAFMFFSGILIKELPQMLVVYYFKYLIWFFLFYAIAYVVSMISSGNVVKFLLTAAAIYYLPAMYIFLINFVSESSIHINISYFDKESIYSILSPGIKIFEELISEKFYLSATSLALRILFAAALTLLGLWIYLRRRNENTEKTIIFPTLGHVLKYVVMLPLTIAAGFGFYYLSDSSSAIWAVFGLICGAVLSFMLINCILTKNTGEMFKKPLSLAIYCTIFGVLLFGLRFAIARTDNYIPDSDDIKFAEIALDYLPLTAYTEKNEINALNSMISKSLDNNQLSFSTQIYSNLSQEILNSIKYPESEESVTISAVTSSKENNLHYYSATLDIEVNYNFGFGLVLPKRYTVTEVSQYKDELRTLINSSAFREMYSELLESFEPSNMNINGSYYNIYSPTDSFSTAGNDLIPIPEFVDDWSEDEINFDYFQNTYVGRVAGDAYHNGQVTYINVPVFYQDLNGYSSELLEEYGLNDSEISQDIEFIELYRSDMTDEPYRIVTDSDEIARLLKHGTHMIERNVQSNFTICDNDYCMVVYLSEFSDSVFDSVYNIYVIPFIEGCVPDFIK